MPKLTKRTVDAIEPQATEFFIWDESIPGFGLRVMPSGRSIRVPTRSARVRMISSRTTNRSLILRS